MPTKELQDAVAAAGSWQAHSRNPSLADLPPPAEALAILSARQQRFVAEYAKGKSATQAAKDAGYSENSAGQQAHVMLKKHDVQTALAATLAEYGLDDQSIALAAARLLTSNKGADVKAGADILLKVRDAGQPKRVLHAHASFKDFAGSQNTEKAKANTAQQSHNTTERRGLALALLPTVSVSRGK